MTAAIVNHGGTALRRLREERGQTVTEYGIVLGILLVLLATTVVMVTPGVQGVVTTVAAKVAGILP